ncbi:chromate efflux transporter [Rubricoccus marinus]|uniref:Chromate transporter n=1 Tax=Rubricoccus marinus TaxID=716817 RepID=A0A259U3I5_9BACT|nr:chromate transporter [Rubricoccus marinus]
MPAAPEARPKASGGLGEVARLFLKLGFIAFGGPAAHIAMMEDEVVERRGWLSRQHFLDLIGATNLIPGPNSTEMTMHVGYERAGWRGLFVAGACFIGPAVLLTGLAAWAYVEYGELPVVEPFLYGIKPAVLAVIAGALWKLGKKAIKGWPLAVISVLVASAVLAGLGEVWALLVGGILGALALRAVAPGDSGTASRWLPILFLQSSGAGLASGASGLGAASSVSMWKLFLFFLKVGSVLYGSGYVLVAFLEGGLVDDLGWLTQGQLLDAIAIGQFTPGPVLSTSTFIGYLVLGVGGAAVATLGIFLPSFVFVGILNPLIPRLRQSAWLSAFLDAVNAAAVALMLAVTLQLGRDVLVSWPAVVIALLAAVAVIRFKLNAVYIVLGGAALGFLLSAWA